MDVSKILAELKAEREQIEEAIGSLERLARGRGRGPGRPPSWMSDTTPKRRGRPPAAVPLPPHLAPPVFLTHRALQRLLPRSGRPAARRNQVAADAQAEIAHN